jgi:hypothetical protein
MKERKAQMQPNRRFFGLSREVRDEQGGNFLSPSAFSIYDSREQMTAEMRGGKFAQPSVFKIKHKLPNPLHRSRGDVCLVK